MPSTKDEYGKDPFISSQISIIIATFIGIALYNVVELNVIILRTIKPGRCLYFWSFIIATWGIVPWSLGYLIKSFHLANGTLLYSIFISIGWCAMVTGQSFVLYSRLQFVLRKQTYLRRVLAMIIFNAVVLHIPTIVMGFGAQSSNPRIWLIVYPIYEKIEVTVFFLQEVILSSLYIIYTTKYFRQNVEILGKKAGKTKHHLIWVNALVIVLDITILALEYGGLYEIQTAYKGMVYSVKLKLEFTILNDLANTTKSRQASPGYAPYCSTHHAHAVTGGVQLTTYTSNKSALTNDEQDPYGERVNAGLAEPYRGTDTSLRGFRVTRNAVPGTEGTGRIDKRADDCSLGGFSMSNLAVNDSARVETSSSETPFAHEGS